MHKINIKKWCISVIIFFSLTFICSCYVVHLINKHVLKPWEYVPPKKVNKINLPKSF